MCVSVCVCVCVDTPYILDVRFVDVPVGVTQCFHATLLCNGVLCFPHFFHL